MDDLKWALSEFASLANGYKVARDYYDGHHQLTFASEKFKSTFGRMFSAFADNLMPVVVETPRDRLKLESFSLADTTVREKAAEIWRRNRMTKRLGEVHLDAFIEGDAYVVVWPDHEGLPVFYPNRASRIVIQYDDEQPGYIVKAAKAWLTADKFARLTLYYRDRIEKYITRNKVQGGLSTNAKLYIRHEDEEDGGWPIENPYDKVPVFHFGNRTSIGQLGRSELSDCIPLQDALNKSIADMLVASEFYGIPQRWAIGLEEMDEDTASKRYKLQAGGVWGSTSDKVQFGQFAPADINQFIEIVNDFRKEIARVSRTPLHHFTLEGTPPSGESMKTAEAPLLAKVEDRQTAWGIVWSDIMRFALEISGIKETEPEPVWIDTTPRNETTEIVNAVTKVNDLGVDLETAQKEIGYSETQIEKMSGTREARAENAPVAARVIARTAPPIIKDLLQPANGRAR